jgi:hypothetical protein
MGEEHVPAMTKVEYRHIWIPSGDKNDAGDETPYSFEQMEEELNRRGEQGWELVNMTPDWEWNVATIDVTHEYQGASEDGPDALPTEYSTEAPYSYPWYISGWYCTFKRPLS